jgi:hypothetical protein
MKTREGVFLSEGDGPFEAILYDGMTQLLYSCGPDLYASLSRRNSLGWGTNERTLFLHRKSQLMVQVSG